MIVFIVLVLFGILIFSLIHIFFNINYKLGNVNKKYISIFINLFIIQTIIILY